jgi:hypothetical protein
MLTLLTGEQKMNKKVTLTMIINPYITACKQIFRLKQHKCSFYKDFGVMELKAKVKTLPVLNEHTPCACVWWSGGAVPITLASVLGGDEWSASLPLTERIPISIG